MNYHVLVLALLIAFLNIKIAFGADEIHWTVIDQSSVTLAGEGQKRPFVMGPRQENTIRR
jgi:hypothetical protein